MHTGQNMKLISTQNVYEKTENGTEVKGFTYFNKTSKESKLRIKVIGNSRWSIPVTDLVKPS